MQCILQASALNILEIPSTIEKLISNLELKANDLHFPPKCYYSRLNEFLEVTLILAGRRFQLRSQIQFSEERFVEEVAKPLITELIKEVKVTFQIPASLQGVSAFDPQNLPQEAEGLESFGIKEVDDLAHYYCNPIQRKNKVFPAILNKDGLISDYKVYKEFVYQDRVKQQNIREVSLETEQIKLEGYKNQLEHGEFLSKRKRLKLKRDVHFSEKNIEQMNKKQKYEFMDAFSAWKCSMYCENHLDLFKMLHLIALIPPSTAEVERLFSLMNLISTPLRRSLSPEHLSQCIRISKFVEFKEEDYKEILNEWLAAEDTKSKSRKVTHLLKNSSKQF